MMTEMVSNVKIFLQLFCDASLIDELRPAEKAIVVVGFASRFDFPVTNGTMWKGCLGFDQGDWMLNSVDVGLSQGESISIDGIREVTTIIPLQ